MGKKITKEEFERRIKEKHGDKYTYTPFYFKTLEDNLVIHCKRCRMNFHQKASYHLSGRGCPYCKTNKNKELRSLSTDKFIELAKLKYPNEYDYSRVNYFGYTSKVNIKCIKHNYWFKQTPSNHLHVKNYIGCEYCNIDKRREAIAKPQEIFLQEARLKHGDKYDYSKIEYINSKLKLSIYCNTCEVYFYQDSTSHLNGRGCPHCADGSVEPDRLGIVYCAIHLKTGKKYVGISVKSLAVRCNQHKVQAMSERSRTPISKVINKEGLEAFNWIILEDNIRAIDLGAREAYWIRHLETKYPNGYNKNTKGGEGLRIKR